MFYIPKREQSPIKHLIEEVPNWKDLSSIYISSCIYRDINNNSSIKQTKNVFVEETVPCEDSSKSYPLLSYELRQISFDLWIVNWIEHNGSRHYFASNPIGSVYLTYKQVA